jgi:hypothetical protein
MQQKRGLVSIIKNKIPKSWIHPLKKSRVRKKGLIFFFFGNKDHGIIDIKKLAYYQEVITLL